MCHLQHILNSNASLQSQPIFHIGPFQLNLTLQNLIQQEFEILVQGKNKQVKATHINIEISIRTINCINNIYSKNIINFLYTKLSNWSD